MKRTLFPTHAIFHKALILFSLFILIMTSAYSQGPKWTTLGNITSTGDFIGPTNFEPLTFKTNNITRGTFTASGDFQLNNLIGTGNRLLQTDANGNIIPFTMGNSGDVLYGDGTWGGLPLMPPELWISTGSDIYYNGKVGIGTSTPAFPLDVIGDVRISNNLYVGGGIVISDKVNANAEVVTGKMIADSIVTDSTKGFYGTTKFNGDVRLSSKINIDGEASVGGTLKLLGGLTFIGLPPASLDPCVDFLAVGSDGTVAAVDATADLTFDPSVSPCPEPPIVPFTWQTWGNHVNHDNRWIGTIENYDFRIKTNSTLRMIVKKDGKIGIGTATPAQQLQIDKGNILVSGTNNFATAGDDAILFLGNDDHFIKGINGVGVKIGTFGVAEGIFLQQSTGNVGIGSDLSDPTNASFKLCVNGNIRAKKVVVDLGWSDFVFEEKYKLRTLKEVESYIAENGHLPEIPSANEIETIGADLGDLVKLQMQKIEELTLYIIEQNKRIELLEKK